MANGHGGYRQPTNPAPVSGPGAHSQRTDGAQPRMALPNAQYGEAQSFDQLQAGAPMAQQGPLSTPAAPVSLADLTKGLTPLSAPSGQPDVPVTAGAAYGAGPGASALGLQDPNKQDAGYFAKYLPTLLKLADSRDAPPGYKSWVRTIIANL